MENKYEHIDALIARRLGGETEADLARELDAWRNISPENERYYQQMLQIWELGPQVREQSTLHFDTESALASVKKRIHPRRRPVVLRMALRAAAALALLLGAYWWFRPGPAPQVITGSPTNILSDTLRDGSVVTLNRNSALSVSSGYNTRERRMQLQGEAYFEVAPNPEKPFIVEVASLEVKVLGTAFNVDNLSTPGKVLISVTHGRVQVLNAAGQNLILVANQAAEFDQQSGVLRLKQLDPDANILAYKSKQFRFQGTRLEQVARQLEQAYGVPILLGNTALRDCPLSANYNNLPLNRALQLIADSFSLTLEQKPDGSYLLNGNSCGE